MKQITKKILAALLILAMVAVFPWTPLEQTAEAATATQLDDLQDAVTLHCWNWSYKAIEQKMATIAGMGYNAIQVSPIQQAKQATAGFQFYDWWVYYQPASFSIDNTGTSALGTKAEFKSMCKAAHKYGISVIVDVVANHMGNGTTENTLSPTIIADLREDSSCWHNIQVNTSNYSSRYDITQYCMDGVPDLNTASKKVQNYVLSFLKECVDAGADGFRFDGAKHIETPDDSSSFASDFWPTVINGIKAYKSNVYIYGETLYGTSDNNSLSMSAYTKYMSVTDAYYGTSIRNVVNGQASSFGSQYYISATADNLVIWAESHDDWAGDANSDSVSKSNINKAWALTAARADAMALYLARPDDISQQLGTASSGTGWDSLEVAYINRFHAKFAGQSEYIDNESGIAYIERGTSGVVLVNCSGTTKSVSVTANKIKNGTYTDQITGNTFTVSGGKISGKIGATGIAVVYAETPCKHTSHNADGICNSCSLPVGHKYGTSNLCSVCGKDGSKTVYFRNTENWSTVNIYAWTGSEQYTGAWPGVAMTQVKGDLYSYVLPPNVENVIFHNAAGTQTKDLLVPTGSDNLYSYSKGTWSYYDDGSGSATPTPSSGTSTPSTSTTVPSAGTSTPSTGTTAPTPSGTVTKPTSGTDVPTGSTAESDTPADTTPVTPDTPAPDVSTPEATTPDATEPDNSGSNGSGENSGSNTGAAEDNADTGSDSTESSGNSLGSYWWILLVILAAAAIVILHISLLRQKKSNKEA